MQQGTFQFRRHGQALFDTFSRFQQCFQASLPVLARHILGRRALEIQRPYAIGAGFQKVRQFIQNGGIDVTAPHTQQPVDDDASPPSIWGSIAQASGHGQAGRQRQQTGSQWQFREIERNGIVSRQIATAIVELQTTRR
ncbi:hypothetical protein PC39_03002 [Salinisphaera sp. PC39]